MSLAQLPLRLTTGAFVLNSGIGKLSLSDEDAEGLQQMAANGVPVLADMSPAAFRRFIAFTEIGVGAAQLIPKVPGWLAGSALSAFSAGLLNMYLNTPGMTQEDGVRPSSDGTAVGCRPERDRRFGGQHHRTSQESRETSCSQDS